MIAALHCVPLRAALAALGVALAGCAYNFPGPQPAPPPQPSTLEGACVEARRLLATGDSGAARDLLAKWVDEARARGGDARLAAALDELGLVESWSGRDDEAIAAFSRSAELAHAAGEPGLAARASLNAADASRRKGDSAAALAAVDRAIALASSVPAPAEKSLLLSGAAARMATPFPERRRAILGQALAQADAAGDLRLRSQALGLLAEQAQQEGRQDEALEATRKAVFAAQAASAPDLLFRWEWQAARLAEARGDNAAALAHYRRAHASLGAFRHDLLVELRLARGSYRDAIGPAFTGYADLLLRTADGERDPAARRERLLEARAALEQMKAVELEDYFQDECVARLQSRARGIEALAPRTAVIYPVILPGRLDLLVSAGSEIEKVSVPVSAAALSSETRAFRRLLEKRSTREYLPHAQRLHDWLLRPLQPFLAAHDIGTLVVVPDGALRGIPFAALHDGDDFLVRRYAIATAPALSLVESGAGALAGRRALVGGLTEPVQEFPGLPQVRQELDEVGRHFESRRLDNAEFRVPEVRAAMASAPYSVVHIASHGEFDSDPRRTFLLTWDGRMGMDELERLVKSGRLRDEPVELLTLSACRTAAGDDRAALGLAGVAVKAGARSALATLWYVNDEASSLLVAQFYGELAAGAPDKAHALQAAQEWLRADARYRHPGYWAPFLMIGNWQ
ncbi:MAG: CHAT domain-containing protein [Burkholderiales bacterium]|nr:CHAT domain-containing protein [Burkholderiales bacterium]